MKTEEGKRKEKERPPSQSSQGAIDEQGAGEFQEQI